MPQLLASAVLLLPTLLALTAHAAEIPIPGLSQPVELAIDKDGVPHLFAANDFDLARAQGYLHAQDRFFQMDVTRREVSGDLAELLGPGSLGNDIQLRTVGLRRAARRTNTSHTNGAPRATAARTTPRIGSIIHSSAGGRQAGRPRPAGASP